MFDYLTKERSHKDFSFYFRVKDNLCYENNKTFNGGNVMLLDIMCDVEVIIIKRLNKKRRRAVIMRDYDKAWKLDMKKWKHVNRLHSWSYWRLW